MLSDLCCDEFDFAWRRPTYQFVDSGGVGDILQKSVSVIAAIDMRHYNRNMLSAALGAIMQTGDYSYGRCMKLLRQALCGDKVRAHYDFHSNVRIEKVFHVRSHT